MTKNTQAMPDGYKRSDVALMKTDAGGVTKAVMKDNTVWLCAKPGEPWAQQDVSKAEAAAVASSVDTTGGADATTQQAKDEAAAFKAAGVVDTSSGQAKATVVDTTALEKENAQLKARIAELEAGHKKGPHEGKAAEGRPKTMAGPWPAKTEDIPTVDELNANNGQPHSA